jgi:hypothetical protein
MGVFTFSLQAWMARIGFWRLSAFESFIPRRWQLYWPKLPARAALFAFGRSDAAFAIKLESGASMNITNRDGCGHGYVESNSFPTSCFGLYERQAPKYLR